MDRRLLLLRLSFHFSTPFSVDSRSCSGAQEGTENAPLDRNPSRFSRQTVEVQVDLDAEKFYKMFVDVLTAPTPKLLTRQQTSRRIVPHRVLAPAAAIMAMGGMKSPRTHLTRTPN